jgi:hypothetical protein
MVTRNARSRRSSFDPCDAELTLWQPFVSALINEKLSPLKIHCHNHGTRVRTHTYTCTKWYVYTSSYQICFSVWPIPYRQQRRASRADDNTVTGGGHRSQYRRCPRSLCVCSLSEASARDPSPPRRAATSCRWFEQGATFHTLHTSQTHTFPRRRHTHTTHITHTDAAHTHAAPQQRRAGRNAVPAE